MRGALSRARRSAAANAPLVSALLAAGAAWPGAADAQVFGQLLDSEIPLTTQTGRNQGVLERQKPELAPVGLPLGSFRLYPDVSAGIGLTTNVVGASANPRSDTFAVVTPQLTLRSDWGRHELRGVVNYTGVRYRWTSPRDEDGFLAELSGRLDVYGDSQVSGAASYRRTYESQQEANFPVNGAGSVAVDQARGMLRAAVVTNRLRWTFSGDFNSFRYNDTVSTTGTRLDLSFRDRDVYRGTVRAEYQLSPDNSIFAQGTYRRTDYVTTNPLDDRTSSEWRGGAGAIADVSELLRVAGGVGYFRRTYASPVFVPIGGIAIDLRADYYLSPLTTISAVASRQPEEAAIRGSPGYIASRTGVRVNHELLRNLVPYVGLDYFTGNFKNIDRKDTGVIAVGGFDYTLNRRWVLSLDANYSSRQSSGAQRGPGINEFRALTSLKFRI
ncbi:outer membrane beta-barrel protein [Sphingomonas sp. RRHST34]|uniref:Outer membrane beta-barrel protein n=1 Tax=Sphingomonas citri TaxID=2862499 RepID=A0ABS7BPW6_9SPHN|nr:outer membrane beta-barrel protein [Sphingomonas citri]MBW6531643.1 outer membrane beta-barrel protein [Sphingomonas citri]